MMITIKNLRREKPLKAYDIKVDRSSVLGNPYFMTNEKERDNVCEQYFNWFYINKHLEKFFMELQKIENLLKKYGKVNLFCWCVPKRCHAETIKQYLEKSLKQEV